MQKHENVCGTGEAIALFDRDGVMTGCSVSRKEAHRNGIPHGASHTFVYKWEGGDLYLLLQRRSLNKDSFPGCLDISSAGHIEFGMDFLSTAVKELKEELGVTVSSDQLQELFTQHVYASNVFHGEPFIDYEFNTVYALEMDCNPASLHMQEEEVSEALWMRADDILADISDGRSSICSDKDEMKRAIRMLKNSKQKQQG